MAKIYIELEQEGNLVQFLGSDNKKYGKLWTIERKIVGNMQLSGATINGELRCIDFTLPTKVNKLPKGAKEVDNETAERLWNMHSWQFGE